ncbi:ABC transporter substrate-binding protein [Cohnella silvisoli]|uniref:ABC transporter substrate-binding protein n=1 Tax=Cohnella silvisoli TaxID=2873699 RepID=A0ABV1KMC4_9BACL|nr:ABC transporter substrate-binding protein [Cohnella silvisoli]MCD9020434.1 ABC transporter substrate-binding protein [Cohnella silvisoli]
MNKGLGLMLAAAMCATLALSACSKSNNGGDASNGSSNPPSSASTQPSASASEPASSKDASLEKVTLKFTLLGEQPQDGAAVMAEVNKKLEADINATIELTYIPFGDIKTKYPLVLASPGDWDVIYGSIDYGSNATKGAYREIPMADIEKYMPLTTAASTKSVWGDALVNGKLYMIPQSFKELGVGSIFFREDLRKKYNVPEIKTPADLEAYFKALKDNEKSMLPVDGTADDVRGLFSMFMGDYMFSNNKQDTYWYNPDDASNTVKSFLDPDYVENFKNAGKVMKRFRDAGYIPKNAFAQKTSSGDLGKAGKTGMWANAFENYPQYATDMAGKGWEVGALPQVTSKGTALQRPSTGNGFSISPKSKNYERALMALDLLNEDKSYNMLLAFGIEGKNYVIKDDGKLALGPGIDTAKNPYPMYGAGWWANNRDQWPPLENYTQGYIDMKKALQEHAVSYLPDSFNIDAESFKTELANYTSVIKQYAYPIQLGAVKDVDKAVDDLVARLKAAGLEKIETEINRQLTEYVASKTAQ